MTTQLLSSGEFCKLRYDTVPVKSASANVSFYTNNPKMPNVQLWHSCHKWVISWTSSSHKFLQPPVISSPSSANILLSTHFPNTLYQCYCIQLTKCAYHSIKDNLVHQLQQVNSFDNWTTSETQSIVIIMINHHHQWCHTHSSTITSSFHTTVWRYTKQIC